MLCLQNCLLVLLAPCIFGVQHQYTVFQENMEISNLDRKVLHITSGVFPINETSNGLNLTFTLQMDLPDDSKISATAFKWINGEYRLGIINIFKSIPSALEMEMFDLQGLFVDHCRPPMIWPLGKGEIHHCVGWNPDSTKFPPNLPGGRYKVPITIMFANNTKFVVVTWYLKLSYKK